MCDKESKERQRHDDNLEEGGRGRPADPEEVEKTVALPEDPKPKVEPDKYLEWVEKRGGFLP